ncbi:MAG: MotA/TolQ/ExbB proton channel family protein [Verrucomicrobiales bacterium]|nr:MotA/TolQ/ExbB proton channel family protein [Verrucomicrobiales bacterium]
MNSLFLASVLGSAPFRFSLEQSSVETRMCLAGLLCLSLVVWIVFARKSSRLMRARLATLGFEESYSSSRDPLELFDRNERFDDAPAFVVYSQGAGEVQHHLHHNPVRFRRQRLISSHSFNALRLTVEEVVEVEVQALGRHLWLLRWIAVGAPLIGCLGTVWGMMSMVVSGAGLPELTPWIGTAMISAVVGIAVGLQSMLAATVLSGRVQTFSIDLRRFGRRFVARVEHVYLDQRPIEDEIEEANEVLASKIVALVQKGRGPLRELPVLASHD